jgi:hypothetical protein
LCWPTDSQKVSIEATAAARFCRCSCCAQILSVDISVDQCLVARVPERLIRLSHEFKPLLGDFLNLVAGVAVAIWQAAPLLSGFVLLYQ